jgi:hypothetical protein
MDDRKIIPEECREQGFDLYSGISQVTFRDYKPHEDLKIVRHILVKYWDTVNRKDLSKITDLEVKGQSISILKVDAKVLQLIEEGIKIRLAIFGDDVIGFMLYRLAFDCLIAIDGMYVLSAFRQRGIGENLIHSLEKPIKKLFFQTHLSNRPSDMFKSLEHMGCTIKKLNRDGDLITWESDWRLKNGDRS